MAQDVPSLADVKTFFLDDPIISALPDSRINYWISDIAAKGIVDSCQWGKLYFNGFMNLMGHYLLIYETNQVSYRGAIKSDTTAAVSRSYAAYEGDDPNMYDYSMTKYGRIFAALQNRLAAVHGGLVSAIGRYIPYGGYPYGFNNGQN